MVNLLRTINCRLLDISANSTEKEISKLEQEISDTVDRVGLKLETLDEIGGYPVIITDVDLLGIDKIEVVNFYYFSEGEFYNQSCPLEVFYKL